jgi:hypothetical protein
MQGLLQRFLRRKVVNKVTVSAAAYWQDSRGGFNCQEFGAGVHLECGLRQHHQRLFNKIIR